MVKKRKEEIVKHFFLGIILTVIIQSLFMLGGLFIENKLGVLITGIPSALGLTLILILGLILYKKSEYILLGGFTIAFISPLILFLIILFNAMKFSYLIYYSTAYLTALIVVVWVYYIYKIWRNSF